MRKTLLAFALLCATLAVAEEPTGYYSSAEGQASENLRQALNKIIGSPSVVGYDNLWTAYQTTDAENGTLLDIYSTCTFSVTGDKCGSYSSVCDCYNREHSVPQSWFGSGSPKSDLFNVYPTDGKVNGQRSNYPYGECSSGTSLGGKALGKLGASTFSGYASSDKVFEPADEYKGDLARSYFYMATCYASLCKSWTAEDPAPFGSANSGLSNYGVALFLKWHRQDPVSQKELDRNEAVYGKQKNRNPFIDHPELAEYIWGNKKGNAWYSGETALTTIAFAELSIYPNPAKEVVTISAEVPELTYSIVSLAGQVLASGVVESGSTIAVNDLANGLYLLKLEADGKSQIEKLIINK